MAFDAYLKIDGIDGESTAQGMEKQIEISSFIWGAMNAATIGSHSGGISGGKANLAALTVLKSLDVASPKLMLAACDGSHLKTAILTIRKATGTPGQKPFQIIKLTDCMISAYRLLHGRVNEPFFTPRTPARGSPSKGPFNGNDAPRHASPLGESEPFHKMPFAKIPFAKIPIPPAGNELPVEVISFDFAKIEMEYYLQKVDGSMQKAGNTGWNRVMNAKA